MTTRPSRKKAGRTTAPARRTQAERRAETQAAVLDSACRQFGSKGYADTSLEAIARDCDVTIAPIYHYFGNKRALFEAVVDTMQDRILATFQRSDAGSGERHSPWRSFLELCRDPAFRQVVLIDAPTVLGRDRWAESTVYRAAGDLLGHDDRTEVARLERRMVLSALAEAALAIAESDDPERLALATEARVAKLLRVFRDGHGTDRERTKS